MSKNDGVVTNDGQVVVGEITDTKNTFVWYILETFLILPEGLLEKSFPVLTVLEP